jgi:mRNA interferase RelE/StbE
MSQYERTEKLATDTRFCRLDIFAIGEYGQKMRLLLEKPARKGLARMPAKAAEAMLTRLEHIAQTPFAKHPNVEAMKGMKDAFRLRQGDWRAVYRLDRAADEMRVVLIDVRGSVYR